jgi:cation diffusion facilitator CzcD-associated flavoprotein CzcO
VTSAQRLCISYKPFEGKRVVILGLGATACDIAVGLVGHAKHVWISHRDGAFIVIHTSIQEGVLLMLL